MNDSFDCPLCPATHLPEDAERCPTCGADLGPLQRLRRLRGVLQAPPRPLQAETRASTDAAVTALPPPQISSAAPDPTVPLPSRRSGWPRAISLAALLVSTALAFSGGLLLGGARTESMPPVASTLPEAMPPTASSTSEALLVAPPPEPPEIPAPLRSGLDALTAFSVVESGASLVVTPRQGLFGPGGVAPLAGSLEPLASLKSALEDAAQAVDVRVEGATDDRPVRPGGAVSDNAELGILRAASVYALLGGGSGPRWSLGVAAESPFPNDTPESRAKNRTVQIVVTPREP